ncbi:MAG: TIGR04076 family protein [Planctomycetota bacterium]
MAPVRITVVRKLDREEIFADVDPGCSSASESVCPMFEEGQQFRAVIDDMPEGFCPGAWTDIFRYVCGLQAGANYDWVNEDGKVLACCNDGFRPVIFLLERMEEGQ